MKTNSFVRETAMVAASLLFITACSEPQEATPEADPSGMVQEQANDAAEEPEVIDWSNPVLIQGSSFGLIINTYFRLGKFEELYQLTDAETKATRDREKIIEQWKKMPMGMDMKLLNKTEEDSVQWLHYEVTIDATRKALRIPVVVEDDTCRVLFEEFKQELYRVIK